MDELDSNHDYVDGPDEATSASIAQAGHGGIADQSYAQSSNLLNKLSKDFVECFRTASRTWHQLLKLPVYDTAFARQEEELLSLHTLPGGLGDGSQHCKVAKTQISSRNQSASDEVTTNSCGNAPDIARSSTVISGGASSSYTATGTKTASTMSIDQAAQSKTTKSPMPVANTAAVTAMLQFLLPASLGEFKSTEQANACELLFKSQMHSLIVLGTGAGKSLLYQLYAMLYHKASQQVTILVVPFVALLADALREAQEKKVPSMIWRDLNTTIDANCALLIVSADLAIGAAFRQSMQQLKSDGNLAGIFIDEMHVPLVYRIFKLDWPLKSARYKTSTLGWCS